MLPFEEEAGRDSAPGPAPAPETDEGLRDPAGADGQDSAPGGPAPSTGDADTREGGQAPGQADPAEPAGDQDPSVEQEYDEARDEAADQRSPINDRRDPAELAAEYLDLAKRSQAELENFRKRAARDAAQAGERAKANFVRELLPVVDNLERALATANPEEDHLAEGVRLVHTELVNTLERNGVKAFDPAGEPFDPTYHEALSTRQGENGAGVVLDVVEKGYRLGDAVIRPARVIVSA